MKDKLLKEKLIKYINEALDKLYEIDDYLIDNKEYYKNKNYNIKNAKYYCSEWSVVFRFAHYLQNLIDLDDELKTYNLDCEYNRNKLDSKRISGRKDGVRPDLIIHRRGSNDYNILIMEFKAHWSDGSKENDYYKLIKFTDSIGEYKFKLGIFVLINESRNQVSMKFFENGEEVKQ